MVMRHPLRENGSATTHDSRDALRDQRQILDQHASVNSHVIHALLSLFLDYFKHYISIEIFNALHTRNRLINRHCSNGDRRVAQNGFTNLMNIAACAEVHYGVSTVMNRG